jgi:hypothetical protein
MVFTQTGTAGFVDGNLVGASSYSGGFDSLYFIHDNSMHGYVDNFNISPVPEPATYVLLGSGLLGLIGIARKRRTLLH